MFTAAQPPKPNGFVNPPTALLDSGAFTDEPHERLTPEGALDRQLGWERWASRTWGDLWTWQALGLVSYDLLIDETWIQGKKHKQRWSLKQAEWAVTDTIEAAKYLASQRTNLGTRTLILSCQGVDAIQYEECAIEVLKFATPDDWIGLGGWCILGRQRSLIPSFWQTLYLILPHVAAAGIKHIHIFGVLYLPVLGGLLNLADSFGLTVSTDSTAPILSCTRSDPKRAGVREAYWRNNVRWWVNTLAQLRRSSFYTRPKQERATRQHSLWD